MASGSVSISQAAISSCPESNRVHLMACEIEHDGEAPVSSYFDKTVREDGTSSGVQDGEKALSASFRGRDLKGCVVNLPAGYTGYVMKEDKRPFTDEEDREMKATHKFSQFTYWNLETPPSNNDAITKAMQWINIASALHGGDVDNQNATPDNIR
ncbi:Ribonuclease H2 subunit C [Desmophyllum pertusum]|uniref:Ribonuclease H2 subunit C n=1 Tax=Desmophyllum pertusum TaxID=174260 RepID=A0A9W9YX62_9CNID|nr:Ribonuclease H2 subunit C [Desmophyllum pertusum]